MADSYQNILALYQETARNLIDAETWRSFLQTAGYNFRLPFDEQVLIYAQRPDAKAVLQTTQWNTAFGRFVKRGAKGIAVIDKARDHHQLKYYFDLSDTEETVRDTILRPVPLWQVQMEDEPAVLKALHQNFDTHENKDPVLAVMEICRGLRTRVADHLQEVMAAEDYEQLYRSSVAHMVISRILGEKESFFNGQDFDDITAFVKVEDLGTFGSAICKQAADILSPMAQAVRHPDTLEHFPERNYNEPTPEHERSNDHENHHLSPSREIPNPQLSLTPDPTTPGQIRFTEADLSDGSRRFPVLKSVDDRSSWDHIWRKSRKRPSAGSVRSPARWPKPREWTNR